MDDPLRHETTLDRLPLGTCAKVASLGVTGCFRRRLLDLGFVPGTSIRAELESPDRGLVAYVVKGARIALRPEDAAKITVINTTSSPWRTPVLPVGATPSCSRAAPNKGIQQPSIALAGNPNTGKSTVFNALTGLRQHVGNWPGKTVARLEGVWLYHERRYRVVDLPGTYSLLSQSPEEEIARDFLLHDAPDCVVVVADATCLERNLNLTIQIMELSSQVVLCVNLMDQAQRLGLSIDGDLLAKRLGIPVVMTCAHRKGDIVRLADTIAAVIDGDIVCQPMQVRYNPQLEEALSEVMSELQALLPDHRLCRWLALRLLDGDSVVQRRVQEMKRQTEQAVCYAV